MAEENAVQQETPAIPGELPDIPEPEKPVIVISNNVGLDVGTMNLVAAKLNGESVESSALRNVFLEIESFNVGNMDLKNISHIKIDDMTYILSQDAYNFANIFNRSISRPMNKGMISSKEIDSVDIISSMIKTLIGTGSLNPDQSKPVCCYSIPANPIDSEIDVTYHKMVFERIINQLDYQPVSLNEATAVIYSECEDTEFTGIGISFGAGMTNIAVVFKAVPVKSFSLSRGGDWIDANTGNSIGIIPNRVNLIKEKDDFTLNDFKIGSKKEQRIREALIYYYKNLISHVTSHIANSLVNLDVDFPEEVPVIISGGTSLVEGFLELFKDIINTYEFPFTIKEVRTATDQLNAVAEGCLIKTLRVS